jgi:hypothetical protein
MSRKLRVMQPNVIRHHRDRLARAGRLLASALLALSASPLLAQTSAPVRIDVTVVSGSASPGSPITISWKLSDKTGVPLNGTIFYYLNSNLVGSDGVKTVNNEGSLGDMYTFTDPAPGVDTLQVALIRPEVASNPPHRLPTELQIPTDTADTTRPASPASAPQVIQNPFLAQGFVTVDTSPKVPVFTGGLTATVRSQLMQAYAPLLLFSYDHDKDELYAPSDVLTYIDAATLTGTNVPSGFVPASKPLAILGSFPPPQPSTPWSTTYGTIATAASVKVGPNGPLPNTLPEGLYVQATSAAQSGAAWSSAMQLKNVGLYGHVTLINPDNFFSDADPDLPGILAARYHCIFTRTPTVLPLPHCGSNVQVVKIEYWQFFGYSDDYYSALAPVNELANDFVNHQGDWCTVQVYVDASWLRSARPERGILAVYHYLHAHQVRFDMTYADGLPSPSTIQVPSPSSNAKGSLYSAVEYHGFNYPSNVYFSVTVDGHTFPLVNPPNLTDNLMAAQDNVLQLASQPVVDNHGGVSTPVFALEHFQHPVVYVEWGGHEFWPTSGWQIYGASKHNGLGRYAYFASAPKDVVPAGTPTSDVTLVTTFSGYWGAPQSHNGPPQGPPLHTQWYWDPAITSANLLQVIESATATLRTD